MAWGTSNGGMPSAADYKRPLSSGYGGTYTDYDAYNRDAINYRRQQEEGRFLEGKKLLQDVMGLFSDNGAYDQAYGNAKRRYMARSASDMVQRGMGNLVNAPALDLAYEKEVRPEFEMGKQTRLTAAMSAMAQYLASYNPAYEQFVQPMSVTTIGPGGGSSGMRMGSSPLAPRSRSASMSDSMNTGPSAMTDPLGDMLNRMEGGGMSGTSPFASARGSYAESMQEMFPIGTEGYGPNGRMTVLGYDPSGQPSLFTDDQWSVGG